MKTKKQIVVRSLIFLSLIHVLLLYIHGMVGSFLTEGQVITSIVVGVLSLGAAGATQDLM